MCFPPMKILKACLLSERGYRKKEERDAHVGYTPLPGSLEQVRLDRHSLLSHEIELEDVGLESTLLGVCGLEQGLRTLAVSCSSEASVSRSVAEGKGGREISVRQYDLENTVMWWFLIASCTLFERSRRHLVQVSRWGHENGGAARRTSTVFLTGFGFDDLIAKSSTSNVKTAFAGMIGG